MPLRIKAAVLILLALLLAAGGCSMTNDPGDTDSLDAEFLSFDLLTSDNGTNLTTSVTGIIDEDAILLYSVDTTVGSYQLVPSYSTNAVSVEVDGEAQESGLSSQDFSSPVVYTLTDSAGNINQITAELLLDSNWNVIGGGNPFIPAYNGYSLKSGLLDYTTPYFCFNNVTLGNGLDPHYYDTGTDTWNGYGAGYPTNVNDYDICTADGELYAVYSTNTNDVEADYTAASTWVGATSFMAGTSSGIRDPQICAFMDDNRVIASWIEDPGATASGTVYIHLFNGGWDAVAKDAGDLANFNVRYMGMVSNGGETVYFACIMEGNPSALHLFEYNALSEIWVDHQIDYNMADWSESAEIIDLFYDSTEDRPVLCLSVPDDSSYYDLRFLYWDETAGSWTNRNGIESLLGFSATELSALSVNWFENKPTVTRYSGGEGIVREWDGENWEQVGTSFISYEPAQASVIRTLTHVSWVLYTDNPAAELNSVEWR